MSPRQIRVLDVMVLAEMSAVFGRCLRDGEVSSAVMAAVLAIACGLHLVFED